MQARCEAQWLDELRPILVASNWEPAQVAQRHNVQAVTDVTGFGLAGHLLEMLRASGHSASLSLDSLPFYSGTLQLIDEGIESTLAPANSQVSERIDGAHNHSQSSRYKALFDPQTSGGLLLAVAPERTKDILAGLQKTVRC